MAADGPNEQQTPTDAKNEKPPDRKVCFGREAFKFSVSLHSLGHNCVCAYVCATVFGDDYFTMIFFVTILPSAVLPRTMLRPFCRPFTRRPSMV